MFKRLFLGMIAAFALIGMLGGLTSRAAKAEPIFQTTLPLEAKNIYFTEAGGEASRFDRSGNGLSRFAGLLTQQGASLFTLEWRTGFPTDADLIVIAGPTTDLTPDQVARLWSYVNNGGRLLLLANTTVETRRAMPAAGGLFALMYADMGMRGLDDVVVNPITEGEGGGNSLEAEFTTANLNANHPVSAGLSQGLYFARARSLEVDSSIQGFTVTTLASTTDTFYGEVAFADYVTTGTAAFNINADRTQGELPLAAAYQNDRTNSRIVLIGDREFATNGVGLYTAPLNSAGFIYPDNARFLINAALWLLDSEPASLDFPTPGPTPTVTLTPTITPTPSPTGAPTTVPTATAAS